MKKISPKAVRWWMRGLIFLLSVGLLVAGPMIPWLVKIIPSLSPLTALSASLAHRSWYSTALWTLPAVLTLGLAMWKGRFFCHSICPLGTLYAVGSLKSAKKKILSARVNGYIFWAIIFASAIGLPSLLFLDPLSTFTRLGAMSTAAHWASWFPGLVIPLMLLLGLFQPLIWCTHICPLGYLFENVKIRKVAPKKVCQTRRELLIGGLIGVPLALLLKNKARAQTPPILPPGAVGLDDFAATCIRCYACVRACPSNVITVRKSGDGIAELCLPELNYDQSEDSYCEEFCTACTQVCPTGAIRPLTEEVKRMRKIGTARVIRDACIGWADKQECMGCDEYCPYNAIESEYIEGIRGSKIAVPVVNPYKCRGCGACQAVCPAVRIGKAIVVDPIRRQELIDQEYEY